MRRNSRVTAHVRVDDDYDEALGAIRGQAKKPQTARKPLMLYVAYPAPHTPWLPARDFVGKSDAGLYGDFLMMVDGQVGRILKAIE